MLGEISAGLSVALMVEVVYQCTVGTCRENIRSRAVFIYTPSAYAYRYTCGRGLIHESIILKQLCKSYITRLYAL